MGEKLTVRKNIYIYIYIVGNFIVERDAIGRGEEEERIDK